MLLRITCIFGLVEIIRVTNKRWFGWAGNHEEYFDGDFETFVYVGF